MSENEKNGRVLAVDFGEKLIGLAMSDPLGIIASPFDTVENRGVRDFVSLLLKLRNEYGIKKVVFGITFKKDGNLTNTAKKAYNFAKKVEKESGINIVFVDESLTSFMADEVMERGGKKVKNRKHKRNSIAASFILRAFLDGEEIKI